MTIFILFVLVLPTVDLAIAGFGYISGFQALRDFGALIQYKVPPDVTNWSPSDWQTSLPSRIGNYPITNLHVVCGTADCAAGNLAFPKYYTFQTSVTLTPMFLKILCPDSASTCSYNIKYSERFQ